MTMPGFTATASLYRARGHYYQAAGEAPSESWQSVALAQPNAPWGVARCNLPAGMEGNLPCFTVKSAYYDRYCNRYVEGVGRGCGWPWQPGPQGESKCTKRTGSFTQTKRLYFDSNCRLVEEVNLCPEGFRACVSNCMREGGIGPYCDDVCQGRCYP